MKKSHLRHLLIWSIIGAMAVAVTGCYAVKLASREEGIDMSKVGPGITRQEVEDLLGEPAKEWDSATGIHYCTSQLSG